MIKEEKEYLQQWLFRANEDLQAANLMSNEADSFTSTICFHCQQAVEKYLKAFLVLHKTEFRKTHDVEHLLILCQKIDNKLFKDIELGDINDFGVDIRYPDDFYLPTVKETKIYISVAKQIKQIVEPVIKVKT